MHSIDSVEDQRSSTEGTNYETVLHFLVPSLNCSLNSNQSSNFYHNYIHDYKPAPYKFSHPVPICAPAELKEKNIRGIDHVTELVNDKVVWKLGRDEIIARNLKVDETPVLKKHKKIETIHREVLRLAEHLDLDPDPNFSGFYNWYYSGGCLNNLFHNNVYSLIYVNNSACGTCVVTPFNIEKPRTSLRDGTVFLETGHKQRIFQVDVDNNFIAARQRNFTSLFTITDDCSLKFKKIHEHSEDKNSIVSVSISNGLNGEYCSLTTSHKLKLWSPNVRDDCVNCIAIESCKKNCDHWGSVKYVSSNNILVSNRFSVYLKDTRLNLESNVQKWNTNFNRVPCDLISLILKSKSEDRTSYIGTTHCLYELDFRKGFSKQWTHMMELPPMYGTVNPLYNGSETVFIGSQNLGEICAIDSNLQVLPYILPSPKETRCESNLRGLCLDPAVSSRFHFSMIGLTSVPCQSSKAFVFRSTSVGDIFYQSVVLKDGCGYSIDDCDINFKSIKKWEKKCNKSIDLTKHKPLNVTNLVDFKKVYRSFSKINSESSTIKTNRKISKNKSLKKLIPKSEFLNATDEFGCCLRDVWDIEEHSDAEDTKQESLLSKGTFNEHHDHNITLGNTSECLNSTSSALNSTIVSPPVKKLPSPHESTKSFSTESVSRLQNSTPNSSLNKKVKISKTKYRFTSGF